MAEAFDAYYVWLGIGPEEQPAHHYRLLGIRLFEPNPEVIDSAADRQMAHLRTFQQGRNAALSQRMLNEVSAARVCLLNPATKAAYDAQLRAAARAATGPLPQTSPNLPVAPPLGCAGRTGSSSAGYELGRLDRQRRGVGGKRKSEAAHLLDCAAEAE